MAALTSPLIGIYTISPMVLYIHTVRKTEPFLTYFDSPRFFVALIIITAIVFFQWMINIWLFLFLDKKNTKSIHSGWKYLFSYSLIMSVVIIMNSVRPEPSNIDFGIFQYYPFIGAFANNTFILIIFSLVTTRHQRAQLELDKSKLELMQYVTQQEQLKNKIHPHFLFNSLNTLKLLTKKNQKLAEDYLVRLSAYLRFSITETAKNTALLKDDLEFCLNYIEMQKVRFNDSIIVENRLPEIINNELLPVVTLQSLAENAIKHNAFSMGTPLVIQIYQNEDQSITFSNNIIPKRKADISTGTGLKNLNERFKLLGCPTPIIKKDNDKKLFMVTFNTIKNEDYYH